MRIPEVREEIRHIGALLREVEDRLSALSAELVRRSPVRGRRTSRRMTPRIEAEIRKLRRDHPHMTQTEIARLVDVNPGRVSEVLRGKRA